jgi:uncharacterized protein (TIGR03118 family)
MKRPISTEGNAPNYKNRRTIILYPLLLFICMFLAQGCKNDSSPELIPRYQVVNLVADTAGYNATIIDPSLKNAWGIAIGPTGAFWVSSNHKGVTTVYDNNGATLLRPVAIPSVNDQFGGAPTGVVYNPTSDFRIPITSQISKFIFAGEGGTLHAWSAGDATQIVADRSAAGAVYKGIAMANDSGANYLYAANFKGRRIDVFDQNFNYVTKSFSDPSIPSDFGPFNIQNIGGTLYVTYAKLKSPDDEDDEKGAGNGFINTFTPSGALIGRFATQGTLNSPWGIVLAPESFGQFRNAILVGNFGDGRINVFDSNGKFEGQLSDGKSIITIDGLWALTFPQNGAPAAGQNQLYFSAGPNDETHGVFGYLKLK